MRAISLHQPWATLVAIGAKGIETRSWAPFPSARGQRIAIQAAKRAPEETGNDRIMVALARAGYGVESALERLPLGAVIATALLVDWVPILSLDDPCRDPRLPRPADDEWHFGNYGPGEKPGSFRCAWILGEVEKLAEPIPARGFQGLWIWEGRP